MAAAFILSDMTIFAKCSVVLIIEYTASYLVLLDNDKIKETIPSKTICMHHAPNISVVIFSNIQRPVRRAESTDETKNY